MSKKFVGKYSRKISKKLGKKVSKKLGKGAKSLSKGIGKDLAKSFSSGLGKDLTDGILRKVQEGKEQAKHRMRSDGDHNQEQGARPNQPKNQRSFQSQRPPAPVKKPVKISAGWATRLLYLAPMPLMFRAFFSDAQGMALNLLAFGILMFAIKLSRDGIKAHKAFDARRVAKRPAFPRKVFGAVLTGLGLFVAGFADSGTFYDPLIFSVLGFVLHMIAFGPDPMRDKQIEGGDSIQSARMSRVLNEAEQHLAAMTTAIGRIRDRDIDRQLNHFQSTVRRMLQTVEEDPRDLNPARKYLGVYLLGARDATVKFTDLYARTHDEKARKDYVDLLQDLEYNFAAKTEKLLLDDRSDLEIEIEVLRERLQRDGVKTGR
jgi:hypothetical protein